MENMTLNENSYVDSRRSLQKPREIIRGRIFSEMIRIQARKSELQAESRSYGPKARVTAGPTPRIRTESPKGKGPGWGLGASAENPPSSL